MSSDLTEEGRMGMNRRGWPAPSGERSCRVCGCWEWDACWTTQRGACWWEQADLCSFCALDDSPVIYTGVYPG